jgi:hypothetical protein
VNVPLAYVALPAVPTWPTSRFSHPLGSGCEVTAKTIALLLFMLGATATTKYPEVAPVGIVIVMDVSLQELIVIGAPFKYTVLFPCELPNAVPVITTWLPIDPVVADTLVMTGAGVVVELTDTLSKETVARELPPLTARPAYAFEAIEMVTFVDTWIQYVASSEM